MRKKSTSWSSRSTHVLQHRVCYAYTTGIFESRTGSGPNLRLNDLIEYGVDACCGHVSGEATAIVEGREEGAIPRLLEDGYGAGDARERGAEDVGF